MIHLISLTLNNQKQSIGRSPETESGYFSTGIIKAHGLFLYLSPLLYSFFKLVFPPNS